MTVEYLHIYIYIYIYSYGYICIREILYKSNDFFFKYLFFQTIFYIINIFFQKI